MSFGGVLTDLAAAPHTCLLPAAGRGECCSTCDEAAEQGHLACLQAARARGKSWSADTSTRAARCGHWQLLLWALSNGCPWDCRNATCYEFVMAKGQLDIILWMQKHYVRPARVRVPGSCAFTNEAAYHAAYLGHLHILQAFVGSLPFSEWTARLRHMNEWTLLRKASEGSQLVVLEWLRQQGCKWKHAVVGNARCVEVLEWALAHGAPEPADFNSDSDFDFDSRLRMRKTWRLYKATLAGRRELQVCFAKAAMLQRRLQGVDVSVQAMAGVPVELVKAIVRRVYYGPTPQQAQAECQFIGRSWEV